MKCFICDTELDENTKVCPCCGKIFTQKDMERLASYNEEKSEPEAGGETSDESVSDGGETIRVDTPDEDNSSANENTVKDNPTEKNDSVFVMNSESPEYEQNGEASFSFVENEEPERQIPNLTTTHVVYRADDDDEEDFEPVKPKRKKTLGDDDIPVQGGSKKSGAKKAIIAVVCIVLVAAAALVVFKVGKSKGWFGEKETTTAKPKEVVSAEMTSETATAAKKNKLGYYKLAGEQMNALLYKSPMATASVIATIPRGTVVIVTDVENDRYGKIKFGTYEGYVDLEICDYLPTLGTETYTGTEDIDAVTADQDKGKYTVALGGDSDYLNVRDDASTYGTAIGKLGEGDEVDVLETKDGWGRINLNGETGWVFMSYLSAVDE